MKKKGEREIDGRLLLFLRPRRRASEESEGASDVSLHFFLSLSVFSLSTPNATQILRTWSALCPERERRAGEAAADRSAEAGAGARQQEREEAAAAAAVDDDDAADDDVGLNLVVRICSSFVPIPVLVSVRGEQTERSLCLCRR